MHKNSKKDYFYRDNLNWFRDVVRIKDTDFETILDYFNALDNNQLEIVYLSKIWD
ncbi:hypothetical protein SAMN05443428_10818 [Caloramator quimbayensis]|uniref:Uncharacterized protein n=1 Tax=Caloramator quimbayensis TaxID=1147123 RepID=A0A1T4XDH5_9CLOT|nr:hypothetical protein SAMN05443428_10818 [Caloramator quimbayensis]